jgi:hypothetical protein
MQVLDRLGFCCPYCTKVSTRYKHSSVPDEGGRLDCDGCGKTFYGWVKADVVFYTDVLGGFGKKFANDLFAVVSVPSWGLSVCRGGHYGRGLIWHVGPFLICT